MMDNRMFGNLAMGGGVYARTQVQPPSQMLLPNSDFYLDETLISAFQKSEGWECNCNINTQQNIRSCS